MTTMHQRFRRTDNLRLQYRALHYVHRAMKQVRSLYSPCDSV